MNPDLSPLLSKITRRPDWAAIFDQQIELKRSVPFMRNGSDCLHQVADVVKAFTDCDVLEGFRGTYQDDLDALRKIHKMENGLLGMFEEVLERKFGLVRLPPKWASRGDIAFVQQDRELLQGAGLFVSGGIFSPSPSKGFTIVPRTTAVAAWHIPFRGERKGLQTYDS